MIVNPRAFVLPPPTPPPFWPRPSVLAPGAASPRAAHCASALRGSCALGACSNPHQEHTGPTRRPVGFLKSALLFALSRRAARTLWCHRVTACGRTKDHLPSTTLPSAATIAFDSVGFCTPSPFPLTAFAVDSRRARICPPSSHQLLLRGRGRGGWHGLPVVVVVAVFHRVLRIGLVRVVGLLGVGSLLALEPALLEPLRYEALSRPAALRYGTARAPG